MDKGLNVLENSNALDDFTTVTSGIVTSGSNEKNRLLLNNKRLYNNVNDHASAIKENQSPSESNERPDPAIAHSSIKSDQKTVKDDNSPVTSSNQATKSTFPIQFKEQNFHDSATTKNEQKPSQPSTTENVDDVTSVQLESSQHENVNSDHLVHFEDNDIGQRNLKGTNSLLPKQHGDQLPLQNDNDYETQEMAITEDDLDTSHYKTLVNAVKQDSIDGYNDLKKRGLNVGSKVELEKCTSGMESTPSFVQDTLNDGLILHREELREETGLLQNNAALNGELANDEKLVYDSDAVVNDTESLTRQNSDPTRQLPIAMDYKHDSISEPTSSISSKIWKDVEYVPSTNLLLSDPPKRKTFLTLDMPLHRGVTRNYSFSSMKLTKSWSYNSSHSKITLRNGASKHSTKKKKSVKRDKESVIVNKHTNHSLPSAITTSWIDDAEQRAIATTAKKGFLSRLPYPVCKICGLSTKVFLLCLLILVLTAGCYIFHETESAEDKNRNEKVVKLEQQLVQLVSNCSFNKSDNIRDLLANFKASILQKVNKDVQWSSWDYEESLMISISLISSIGIQVSLTFNGMLAAIFYTIVGLPISVVFVWSYSRSLAKSVKYVYHKIVPPKNTQSPPKRYSVGDSDFTEIQYVPMKITISIFIISFIIMALLFSVITGSDILNSFFATVQLFSLNTSVDHYEAGKKSLGVAISLICWTYVVFILLATFIRLVYTPWKQFLIKLDFVTADFGSKVKAKVLRSKPTPVNRMNSSQLSRKINELTVPTSFVNSRVMAFDDGGRTVGLMTSIDREIKPRQ